MTESLVSNIDMAQAATSRWDVAIVGAGPAGGLAGLLLARRGRKVLIVERARLPREKPCGCCLSSLGVRILEQHALGHLVETARRLQEVELRSRTRRLRFSIPAGRAIRRSVLDTELARAAMHTSAAYLGECGAQLLPALEADDHRRLMLSGAGGKCEISASMVLACDGIRGKLLDDEPGCRWQVACDAWMGAAGTLEDEPAAAGLFEPGVIYMHIGRHGYVGIVRLEENCVHFAAALEPAAAREAGGPLSLINGILRQCGVDLALPPHSITGTPLLTRKRMMLGSHRALSLGDASGYIEPFTGEGMTWALTAATLLVDALPEDLALWPDDGAARWTAINRRCFRRQHQLCRLLRYALHRPAVYHSALTLMSGMPRAVDKAVHMINRDPPIGATI